MTPLSKVVDIINMLKAQDDIFTNEEIPNMYARSGVIQASIDLGKDWNVYSKTTLDDDGNEINEYYIREALDSKEIYFCGIHGFRNYALQKHSGFANKATNFKTINFAVHGLTERAKEVMRIVWWCDSEIKRLIPLLNPVYGVSTQMEG